MKSETRADLSHCWAVVAEYLMQAHHLDSHTDTDTHTDTDELGSKRDLMDTVAADML